MAKIIEAQNSERRMIRLSTDDIISVVQDYQRIVPRFSDYNQIRNHLSDVIIYIPEEV